MTARLTIVIPTFNRAELLIRAVESAIAQTSDQICIFVSDNASTDETWELLQRYSDPRLRIVRRAVNCSRTAHGRLILREVNTEFLVTLSDDDYLEPAFSEAVLSLFDKFPYLSFVYTGSVEHYYNENFRTPIGPELEDPMVFMLEYFASRRRVAWCSCVCRTADVQRIGLPPNDILLGDLHFWTKIAFQGPVGCVGQRLSHYTALRPGGDNESKLVSIEELASQTRAMLEDVLELAKNHGGGGDYLKLLARNMRRHLCYSTTTHFVFARIAGSTRKDCLRAVPSLEVHGWTLGAAARVVAALVLPRSWLRWLVLLNARGGGNPAHRGAPERG